MKELLIGIVLVSLLAKIGFHMHLDWKHDRFEGFKPAFMQPIANFFFYVMDVKEKFEFEKKVCNILYIILISSIVATFFYRGFS